MLGQWTLIFETCRNHSTEIRLKDSSGAFVNLSGLYARFEIAHDDGVIVWSTADGHVSIPAPATQGTLILNVPKSEIQTLPFEWAEFKFYLGSDSENVDPVYTGKASRQ